MSKKQGWKRVRPRVKKAGKENTGIGKTLAEKPCREKIVGKRPGGKVLVTTSHALTTLGASTINKRPPQQTLLFLKKLQPCSVCYVSADNVASLPFSLEQ